MKALWLAVALVGCGGSPPKPPPPPPPSEVDDVDPPDPEVVGQEGDDVIEWHPRDTATENLLDEANRILGAMRTTVYVHKTTIDEATGRFEFDCSGFVGYALRSQPHALDALRKATVRRPLAKHFVAFFQSLPNWSLDDSGPWRRVQRADELAPGDVIAWLKPADVVTKNTGHVMIVREPPRVDRNGVVIVPIIDSTGVPHGKGDSRKKSKRTGLGTGEVLLIVDDSGAPIAYRWSRGKKAKVHETTITLARLVTTKTAQK